MTHMNNPTTYRAAERIIEEIQTPEVDAETNDTLIGDVHKTDHRIWNHGSTQTSSGDMYLGGLMCE